MQRQGPDWSYDPSILNSLRNTTNGWTFPAPTAVSLPMAIQPLMAPQIPQVLPPKSLTNTQIWGLQSALPNPQPSQAGGTESQSNDLQNLDAFMGMDISGLLPKGLFSDEEENRRNSEEEDGAPVITMSEQRDANTSISKINSDKETDLQSGFDTNIHDTGKHIYY